MRKLELVSVAMFVWLLQFATFNKVEGGDQAKPDCNDTCGNVTIKYPFGIGKNCFLNESFEVNCNNGVPTLANSNCSMAFKISEINFPNQVVLESDKIMAVHCPDGNSSITRDVSFNFAKPFVVSSVANRFRAMGCKTTAYINNADVDFMSLCYTQWTISNGTKKHGGLGQCQIAVPEGLSGYNYSLTDDVLTSDKNYPRTCSGTCNFAVLVKEDFKFNYKSMFDSYPKKVNTAIRYPLVVDWEIQVSSCRPNNTSDICGKNAWCNYTEGNSGFHCYCNENCTGNPYLDGTGGCQTRELPRDPDWEKPLIIAAGVLSTAMVGASLYSYGSWSKMKAVTKLTFKLLQDLHNIGDGSFPDTPVFPDTYSDVGDPSSFHFNQHDLKKAIKLYQKGKRIAIWASRRRVATANLSGHGVVEVRKYTVQERSHLPLFVKGVRTLSRSTLTHANVATLLGISTRESSLIYKHFSDRTLHDSLRGSTSDRPSWEERLKIAAGTARGLAFTHSKGLYHGNVKSSNILIDEECNCKLVEFGVARVWRKNTLLKSSRGYVDQDYMNLGTNQLTATMDVYSFGVVLVELITGHDPSGKAFNGRGRSSLAMVFVSAVDENRLEEVVDHSIWAVERKEELLGVAKLAKECLEQGRKKRPKMQTVSDSLLNWAPNGPRPQGGRSTNATGSQPGVAQNSDLQGQAQLALDEGQNVRENFAQGGDDGGIFEY